MRCQKIGQNRKKNDATFENIRSICSPPMDTVVEALGVVSATVSDTDPWKWPFLNIYMDTGGTRSSQDNNRQREKISNKIKMFSTEKKSYFPHVYWKEKGKTLKGSRPQRHSTAAKTISLGCVTLDGLLRVILLATTTHICIGALSLSLYIIPLVKQVFFFVRYIMMGRVIYSCKNIGNWFCWFPR